MRQIPSAYFMKEHGPVYAYAADDAKKRAVCITWDDRAVLCHHDELEPLSDQNLTPQAEMVRALAFDICEWHAEGRDRAPFKRESAIGDALFGMHIWFTVLRP